MPNWPTGFWQKWFSGGLRAKFVIKDGWTNQSLKEMAVMCRTFMLVDSSKNIKSSIASFPLLLVLLSLCLRTGMQDNNFPTTRSKVHGIKNGGIFFFLLNVSQFLQVRQKKKNCLFALSRPTEKSQKSWVAFLFLSFLFPFITLKNSEFLPKKYH